MRTPQALLIVESPNKAQKINGMFGGAVCAMATYGHICDLPRNPTEGIGIDRATMMGLYDLTRDSSRRMDGARSVAKLRKFLQDNPGVPIYLGTDPDREGESIAAFAMKYLRIKDARRVRFTAITKEKIEEALRGAGPIDWAAVASREARRLIDRVIGYVASPQLASMIKQRGVSAGRVQTAVEALIVERERKIREHKAADYFTVHLDLGGWNADWVVERATPKKAGPKPNAEFDIDEQAPRCFDLLAAQAAANQRALTVEAIAEGFEERLPPSPFHTFALVQAADRVLGWDAERTMQVAQQLFEGDGAGHGHITYHRTDCPNIEVEAAEEIRALLRAQGLAVPDTPNRWKVKNKAAQEGHEATRPTYIHVEEAGATDDQRALYRLIRERALYSQLAPARYSVKKVSLSDPTGQLKYSATARSLIDPGWLASPAAKTPAMQEEEPGSDAESAAKVRIPSLGRGAMIHVRHADVRTHKTKKPPRYTARTLTAKLEVLGIGRPATLVSILKNLPLKGTVKIRPDKGFEATPLAERCYDLLYPAFGFSHIGYTAELERALDEIGGGRLDGPALVRHVWDQLDRDCAALGGA